MPKSKGRGKKYSPKPFSVNSLEWTLAGAHLLPATRRAELFEPVETAFDALHQGAASMEQWYTIDNGLRLSEALIALNIGNNLAPQIADGRRALDWIGLRLRAFGTSTCTPVERDMIGEAVELYRVQLRLCTQAEISKAVCRVRHLITSSTSPNIENTLRAQHDTLVS